MAKELVKIGTGKEFYHVQAVANGKGYLNLEKGDFATVRFDKTKRKLEIRLKVGDSVSRKFKLVEEWQEANEIAQRANEQGEQTGRSFGTISQEEEMALRFWRNYVLTRDEQGNPVEFRLVDILREAIEREEHKDETPFFSIVAEDFLELKEKSSKLTQDYLRRVKNRLKEFSAYFEGVRIGDISIEDLNEAIFDIVFDHSGNAPADKTIKHWQAIAKEVFDWFYQKTNAKKRFNERLVNPLETLRFQKVEKLTSPQVLPVEQARLILSELWESDKSLLPVVIAQLFCGMRNAEALRLRWGDLRNGEFVLKRENVKTRTARTVPLDEIALKWIDALKKTGFPTPPDSLLYPKNDTPSSELSKLTDRQRQIRIEADFDLRQKKFARDIKRICDRLEVVKPVNAFRHTAISVMCRIHGFSITADRCGHSIRQQGDAYRTAMTKQEARDYFNIQPPNVDGLGKTVVFDRSAKRSQEDSSQEDNSGETTKEEKASNA